MKCCIKKKNYEIFFPFSEKKRLLTIYLKKKDWLQFFKKKF